MVKRMLRHAVGQRIGWCAAASVALLIGAAAVLRAGPADDTGLHSRGVVTIAGQHYLHVVRKVHDYPPTDDHHVSVMTDNGICAVSMLYATIDGDRVLVRHFDSWGNPLHAPVFLDGEETYRPTFVSCSTYAGRTCVVWNSITAGSWDTYFANIVESTGTMSGVFTVAHEQDRSFMRARVGLRAGGIAVAYSSANLFGNINGDTWIQFLDGDGLPTSGPHPVATGPKTESPTTVVLMGNGTAFVGFQQTVNCCIDTARTVIAHPSGLIGPIEQLSQRSATTVAQLQTDGSVLVLLHEYDEGPPATSVWRYDALGEPLGDAAPLPEAGGRLAANKHGRIVLGSSDGVTNPWLTLLNPDLSVAFSHFEIGGANPPPSPDYGFAIQPLALDDSETIWALIEASTSFYYQFYLCMLRPFTPGDLNADGSLNNFDIDAFVAALVDREAYHVAYPDVPLDVIDFLGDMNGDGVLNNFDIDPFVEALVGAP